MEGWLYEDVGCEPGDFSRTCSFANRKLSFEPVVEDLNETSKFDVLVGLIRFVDVLSLQKLDELLTEIGAGRTTPCIILIYRNENESDFKMSCPYCGQKLWVRDADQDKRGRCPHCKKGFTLPDQEEHLKSVLRLPVSVKVSKIIRQDPGSFAAPLRAMIESSSVESSLQNLDLEEQSILSSKTMKVNVVEES
ncbi:MAG: hypothetical protein ACO3N7_06325 [Kiritimatiellia bacterium]